MRALSPAELLDLWEAGTTQPRWMWAHALIGAMYPELGAGRIDALTVGQRDARLLEIREALFGAQLTARAQCPACRAPVELDLSTMELRAAGGNPAPEVGRGVPAEPPQRSSRPDPRLTGDGSPYLQHSEVEPDVPGGLEQSDWQTSPTGTPGSTSESNGAPECATDEIHFRVPTARDVADTASTPNSAALRAALLDRCVRATRFDGHAVGLGEIPIATLDEVIAGMAAADPQADLRLALNCPECGHTWSETFDIVSYLWTELEGWAQRLLRDVHLLASAYGWREADVLALSPRRRARYLEMIGA